MLKTCEHDKELRLTRHEIEAICRRAFGETARLESVRGVGAGTVHSL